ncbi:MAG: hypothetical protein HDR82_02370 [Bacteroides sp.]|nr:hypothetical protein [Bacteroides sp.]
MVKYFSIIALICCITISLVVMGCNQNGSIPANSHRPELTQKQIQALARYEYWKDSVDNLPYGNYYLIQPGLYSIANQMTKEEGRMRRKGDNYIPITAYPIILNILLNKNLNNTDTLKFNWHNDTILCKNYSKDNNGYFTYNCEVVSSVDSMKVYNIGDDPFFTHGFYMDDRYKDSYMRAIRHWDEKLLDEIFLPDSCYWTYESLVISRLVIENGKLIDVKSMLSRGVREPYSILPKK